MPPFILAGNPQTINESNDFGQVNLDIFEEAENQYGDAVILNYSNDGVSCKVEWNKSLTLYYLDGDNNHISFPDPNQNANDIRYQLISGSYPETMANSVV